MVLAGELYKDVVLLLSLTIHAGFFNSLSCNLISVKESCYMFFLFTCSLNCLLALDFGGWKHHFSLVESICRDMVWIMFVHKLTAVEYVKKTTKY